jgi:hypothetical protein
LAKLPKIGGLLAFTLCSTLSLHAFAAAPSDAIMSSATRGFASVANAKQLEANWNKTQMGHLVKDEAMQPFVADLKRQIERKLSDTRTKLGLTIEDLRDVATGEIGIGLVEQKSARAAVAITIDVTGNVPAAQTLLGKIDEELVQRRKAKASKATAGGVEMTIYAIPPQSEKDIAREAVFFINQEMLCATDSRVEAQEMIARFGGGQGNRLADVKAYTTTMGRCAAESAGLAPEVRWYVEPFGYARASRSMISGEELAKRGKDYVSILEHQGFDAIQGIGGFVNLAAYGSFEVLHRTSVYAPAVVNNPEKYKLAMRIMQFPNAEKMPPEPWIPRSLASYRTFNMDLQNAYKYVGTLFDAIAGYENAFTDAMDGLETDPYGPQIDVQKEFIQHLGQRISLFTDYELPITTKSERFMFMVELKNEAAIAKTVEKYMDADPNAQRREFQGKVVWEIKPAQEEIPELEIDLDPVGPAAGAGADESGTKNTAMSTSAVCVTDGHLLIASHLAFLEKMLAAKKKGSQLTDAPDFREVEVTLNQLLPGPVAARCFRRTDEAYRPTYELLRQGKMPESETLLGRLLNRLLTTPEDEEEGHLRQQKIDGRQLPPFEMVRRYFSPAGIVVRSLDDGWFVVGATLTKQAPQANLGEVPVREAARVR